MGQEREEDRLAKVKEGKRDREGSTFQNPSHALQLKDPGGPKMTLTPAQRLLWSGEETEAEKRVSFLYRFAYFLCYQRKSNSVLNSSAVSVQFTCYTDHMPREEVSCSPRMPHGWSSGKD